MSEIQRKTLILILDSLNSELKKNCVKKELKIFGSGALMLLNLSKATRETSDLDVLSPRGDVELLKASEIVAAKHNLDPEWLNSIGHRFIKYLPFKWDTRLELVYRGSNVKVYSLSRSDLLFTKAKALYNRGTRDDLEDLISLSLSLKEIERVYQENTFSDKRRLQAVLREIRAEYENI